MRFADVGDSALLVETDGSADAHRVWSALRAADLPGIDDCVVGARSVLVVVDPRVADLDRVRQVAGTPGPEASAAPGRTVDVPVTYDGADLDDVAEITRLSTVDVVRRHSAATYLVSFLGFSPGFAYLSGVDPVLQVPRRETPRTRVPVGAVAIAGEYSAVYPQETPGGWRLIGRTDLRVFDAGRADRPALLAPGDRVRFVPR
jgi:KipI family sensor histidine kinase inhibitor